LCDIPATDAVS